MAYKVIDEKELERLVEALEDALVVVDSVDHESDIIDFAYAHGYGRSCLETMKWYLESINATESHDPYWT